MLLRVSLTGLPLCWSLRLEKPSETLVCERWKGILLEVVVTGDRSQGPDDRLSKIVVAALFRGDITTSQAASFVDEAKPLCTVANALLAAPAIVYESRTMNNAPRDRRRPEPQPAIPPG